MSKEDGKYQQNSHDTHTHVFTGLVRIHGLTRINPSKGAFYSLFVFSLYSLSSPLSHLVTPSSCSYSSSHSKKSITL